MPSFTFTIKRLPRPKQSARFFALPAKKAGQRSQVRSYQKSKVKDHCNAIRADIIVAWWGKDALLGPVELVTVHKFPWPKSTPRYKREDPERYRPKITRPDRGSLTKALEDAMQGIVYRDDAQVWHNDESKICYDGPGETEVTVVWDDE